MSIPLVTAGDHEAQTRALLACLGTAMVASGETVHEVEDELAEVSAHLGYPHAQFAAAPSGVMLNLSVGGPASYLSAFPALRLDQAVDVRRIRHQLLGDELSTAEAMRQLTALPTKPSRYAPWVYWVGAVGVAVGVAMILQPGLVNIAVAAVAAVVVTLLSRWSQHNELLATLLPAVAAFSAGCLVFLASNAGMLDGSLRTLLPPLAVMLPGALLVTGMSDLATGDMIAGSSRLTYGIVQLLLLSLGIVAAAQVTRQDLASLGNIRVDELGWWAPTLGLVVTGLAVCLLESASFRLLPWIMAVLLLAFSAQLGGQMLGGATLGGFLGAIAATLGASLSETIRPSLPRLVIFMPAFWLLVPGSLGLLSITELAVRPSNPTGTGFDAVTVVCAIALGLLVGSAIGRSARTLARRGRAAAR